MKWHKEKMESLIQEEASRFLVENSNFAEGTFATVTRAELSLDGAVADVFVSLYPTEHIGKFLVELRQLSTEFNKEFRETHRENGVPRVVFKFDDTELKKMNIERLLDNNT
jgi:ribosome-binding factor A